MEQRASVTSNGLSTASRFDFEAFRFVRHRDRPRSSIYVHCILRLCEPSRCRELLSVSWRRLQGSSGVTGVITVSVLSGLRQQEEESAHSFWDTGLGVCHALAWTSVHGRRRSEPATEPTHRMTEAFSLTLSVAPLPPEKPLAAPYSEYFPI